MNLFCATLCRVWRKLLIYNTAKLPTYKSLQAEIEQLTAEKNALYNEYRANKERVRELQTMKSNLSQMHHGEPSRQKKHEQER